MITTEEEIEAQTAFAAMELADFSHADQEFNAIMYDQNIEDYILEDGEYINYPSEDMDEDALEEWADEQGYLEEDEREYYTKEDGSLDYEAIREAVKVYEQEYLPTDATPAGRAFLWFEEYCPPLPNDLSVNIIDGAHPGNDFQGVQVIGFKTLVALQKLLFEGGYKVNFTIKTT